MLNLTSKRTTKQSLVIRFASLALLPLLALDFALADQPVEITSSMKDKMQGLRTTLEEILIDVSSDAPWLKKNPPERFIPNVKKLSTLAHSIEKTQKELKDQDPSVTLFAHLFAEETEHALTQVSRGNYSYSRSVLRSMTGFCIACHTRRPGQEFDFGTNEKALKGLRGIERAEFFAASRQFEKALTETKKIVANTNLLQTEPFDWEHALRTGLAVTVRVKDSPDQALSLIELALKQKGVPIYLRSQLQAWKESSLAWKADSKKTGTTLKEGLRILSQAQKSQRFPADKRGAVDFLRATATLHGYLQKAETRTAAGSKDAARALYGLGQSYAVLDDFVSWDYYDFYFVACIKMQPHSALARDCYRDFEESQYAAYSGSGGTSLPSDVQKRLTELEAASRAESRESKDGVERPN